MTMVPRMSRCVSACTSAGIGVPPIVNERVSVRPAPTSVYTRSLNKPYDPLRASNDPIRTKWRFSRMSEMAIERFVPLCGKFAVP